MKRIEQQTRIQNTVKRMGWSSLQKQLTTLNPSLFSQKNIILNVWQVSEYAPEYWTICTH